MAISIDVVTVYQPWATLIAEGLKWIEFREEHATKRAAPYVGKRIGIHAAARPVRLAEVQQLMGFLTSERWRETGIIKAGRGRALDVLQQIFDAPDLVAHSAIVCTCRLGTPLAGEELATALGLQHRGSDWVNWGWPLLETRKLTPRIAAKGARGFWKFQVPDCLHLAEEEMA